MKRLVLALPFAFQLAACGAPMPGDEDFEGTGVNGSALEVAGILRFVNSVEATVAVLDADVGLDVRAARGIVRYVNGRDNRRGTADDRAFATLAELDAISYVGPSAFEKLSDYVLESGRLPDLLVEDVAFTAIEAEVVVSFANSASFEELDEGAALDARAARAIEAARPIAGLEQLATLAYVGTKALTNLREFANLNQNSIAITSALDWRAVGSDRANALPSGNWFAPSYEDSHWAAAAKPAPTNCGMTGSAPANPWERESESMWESRDRFSAFMRTEFEVPPGAQVTRALITAVADDDIAVWLNGELVFRESDWGLVDGNTMPANTLDLAPFLQPGSNTLAVQALDTVGGCRWLMISGSINFTML
jgi:hypothetical protein